MQSSCSSDAFVFCDTCGVRMNEEHDKCDCNQAEQEAPLPPEVEFPWHELVESRGKRRRRATTRRNAGKRARRRRIEEEEETEERSRISQPSMSEMISKAAHVQRSMEQCKSGDIFV